MDSVQNTKRAAVGVMQMAVWFVAGYLVTFVCLFALPVSYFDGHRWLRTSTWQFYQLYLRDEEVRPGVFFANLNKSVLMSNQATQVFMSVLTGIMAVWIIRLLSKMRA